MKRKTPKCEHGDHPNYMFHVNISYIGDDPLFGHRFVDGNGRKFIDMNDNYARHRFTAVVYVDKCVALCIYETGYSLWSLRTGKHLGGETWFDPTEFRMDECDRLACIRAYKEIEKGR